jgi:uncharacterized protein
MKFTIGVSDSKNVKVDAMVLSDTRALINASSGLGKSWLMRLIAENVASSIQTIIVDPEGEFPTLREKFDMLIVSENGDLHADIRSARLLARRLAETGVSAVIDIYDLPGKEDPWLKRRMFVAELIDEWMNLPKKLYHPMIMMLDEAHQFAQEKPSNDFMMWQGKKVYPSLLSRSAVRSMMSAGRKRGIGGILATQRISKIDKDSIADVRNWFVGGSTLDIDQQRAGDILGMTKAEATVTLRDLEPGTFFAFGPAIEGKGVIQFTSGAVQTTHPKAGQRSSIVVPKASTQISGIVKQFGDLPAIAEEEVQTMDALKRENTDLRRQLRERPTQVESKIETKIERVEVPILPIEEFREIIESLTYLRVFTEDMKRIAENIEVYPLSLQGMMDRLKQAADTWSTLPPAGNWLLKSGAKPVIGGVDRSSHKDQTMKAVVRTNRKEITSVDEITGAQQRILDAAAWLESVGISYQKRVIVASLAGRSVKSSQWGTDLSSLREAGLIDYPGSDSLRLSDSGRAVANKQTSPITTEAVQSAVLSRLPRAKARILEILINNYPDPVDREELAAQAGRSIKSSQWGTDLSYLRELGVIDYPSSTTAIALPVLFLE